MPLFTYRCRADHHFKAEGSYSAFDKARVCGVNGCMEPAFMLVDQMAAMHAPDSATVRMDREIYANHNVTHTDVRNGGQIIASPNEHSAQCGCENCCRHRKRASRTETADKHKEVRL